jgi:hypothetical protein
VATDRPRELARHALDEPRPVEVLRDGAWWPGQQLGWLLCNDGRGWVAYVRYRVAYEWGQGQHLHYVTADRLQLRGAD